MLNRCFATVLISSIFLLGGCGGNRVLPATATCTAIAPQEFVYQLTGSSVSMFTMDTCTGMLTATTPASVSTGISPGQLGAEDMVVDPLGRFAYVANLVSNASSQSTVAMYTINPSSGVLSTTTPPTIPTGFFPQGMGIDPQGKFVYTANSNDNTISMFTINSTTGVLSPNSPATVASGLSPLSITVDPSGRFAYAANQNDGTISMYTINGAGVLIPTTPPSVHAVSGSFGVTVDPAGKFVYVPNNDGSSVWQASIDSITGVLTPLSPSLVFTGAGPTAVAVDPSGKFAYVVNRSDNTVSLFTINSSTGALVPNSSMTTIATGTQPFRVLFSRSGKFLYVVNEASATSVYTINTDGTLKAAGTTGLAALSMGIAPRK